MTYIKRMGGNEKGRKGNEGEGECESQILLPSKGFGLLRMKGKIDPSDNPPFPSPRVI